MSRICSQTDSQTDFQGSSLKVDGQIQQMNAQALMCQDFPRLLKCQELICTIVQR